jgi:hypothetical protein
MWLLCQVPESLCSFAPKANILLAAIKTGMTFVVAQKTLHFLDTFDLDVRISWPWPRKLTLGMQYCVVANRMADQSWHVWIWVLTLNMYILQVQFRKFTFVKHVLNTLIASVRLLIFLPRLRMLGGIPPLPTLHIVVHNDLFIFVFCERSRLCNILAYYGGCTEENSSVFLQNNFPPNFTAVLPPAYSWYVT